MIELDNPKIGDIVSAAMIAEEDFETKNGSGYFNPYEKNSKLFKVYCWSWQAMHISRNNGIK